MLLTMEEKLSGGVVRPSLQKPGEKHRGKPLTRTAMDDLRRYGEFVALQSRVFHLDYLWMGAIQAVFHRGHRGSLFQWRTPWAGPKKDRRRWADLVLLDDRLREHGIPPEEFVTAAMAYFHQCHRGFHPNIRQVSGPFGRELWRLWRIRRRLAEARKEWDMLGRCPKCKYLNEPSETNCCWCGCSLVEVVDPWPDRAAAAVAPTPSYSGTCTSVQSGAEKK